MIALILSNYGLVMAFTQAHIDALETAIASGVLIVEYTDGQTRTKTEYQSASQMLTVLNRMRNEVSATSATYNAPPQVIRTYRSTNNGL
jgi:agmatine/peptidylarginine deiminase